VLRNDPNQTDLFHSPVFETREAVPTIDPDRFTYRIKTAMSAVLKEGEFDRHEIASNMGRILNIGTVSKGMLDNYTSPSKTGHDISLIRFKAFIRATGAAHLWDLAVSDEGLLVLQGDEARLAEIAHLQQEQRKLSSQIKQLQARPVDIKRGS